MEWDDSVECHGPDLRALAVAKDAQLPSIEWVDVGCLPKPQPSVVGGGYMLATRQRDAVDLILRNLQTTC